VKSRTIAIVLGVVGLLFVILVVAGYQLQSATAQQELDLTKQSFSHKDKKPGGCYVMYQALPHLLAPGVPVNVVTKPFANTYKKNKDMATGEGGLYFLVANNLFTTAEDVEDMVNYAKGGNQLFIAVNYPDSVLLLRLGLAYHDWGYFDEPPSEQHFVNPNLAPDTAFRAPNIPGEGGYFTDWDTATTTILGTDTTHRPNFVRVTCGTGNIFVLLHPSSVTNYFLLRGKNITSLENELGYTNMFASEVYWDEFYKYQDQPRNGDFSEWQVLMRYPAMRWALWLAIIGLLVYLIFESKRRQRIIPVKPVLTNNSLEFVDALGQLYYQQHNNANLANKMIQQWLEFIRTRYYLNTNHLNQQFIQLLAHKSGIPIATVQQIIDNIHHIHLAEKVSDSFLQEFYKNIQAFYLNTK
jgi:hypothetical protein